MVFLGVKSEAHDHMYQSRLHKYMQAKNPDVL
jgi:hypothetical protein